MVKITVRKAAADDIQHIVALERGSATSAHWAQADYERLAAELGTDRRVALVAESASAVVGFMVGQYVGAEWEIQNVVVAEAGKRKGIGSTMLQEFIALARGESAESIFLEVRQSNIAACALYAKFRFEESGRRKAYYSNPDEDALVLKLESL
ncbi:MAG: ribosomal protein S18P -alanine acetyltransferase [Acidobacteriales bacterium]|nr:ribosomal protein S18P -alanine acetyltransferase [Terriglobales bacterium]